MRATTSRPSRIRTSAPRVARGRTRSSTSTAAAATPPVGRPPFALAVTTWRETIARLSPPDASLLLGVSLSTWGRIERGTSVLSVVELGKLEDAHPGLVALLYPRVVRSLRRSAVRTARSRSKLRRRS